MAVGAGLDRTEIRRSRLLPDQPPRIDPTQSTDAIISSCAQPARALPNEDAAFESVESLTAGMSRGDENAWREFHQRYFNRLHRYLIVLERGNPARSRFLEPPESDDFCVLDHGFETSGEKNRR
jgi:hypothetical protein